MTRIALLTTAIVTGLMVTTGANAFGGAQGSLERPSFAQIDTDGDGKLTAAEMQALPAIMAAERFKAADTDGDGKMSKEELAAAITQQRENRDAERAERMISRFDADKDGAVSEQEMLDSMGQGRKASPGERFIAMADTDKDGAVSEEEFAAAAERMEERHARSDRDQKGRGGKGGWDGRNNDRMPFWRN
ncbi:EF-hand domain-containing protein [Tropicimonas aquimaris]|uniref:EF-hand domain-containing protein n=1 Tax=Tropicimonas aquimaris TaxID=914152 RepID=A0ABW3IK19_9RHOB